MVQEVGSCAFERPGRSVLAEFHARSRRVEPLSGYPGGCGGVLAQGVLREEGNHRSAEVLLRFTRFLQTALVFALVASSPPASSNGPGGGHGAHFGSHVGGHGFHGFHGGRGRAFHGFHGVLFVGPLDDSFGFVPGPLSTEGPVVPFGCEPGAPGCDFAPSGIGLLQAGPSLPESALAETEEVDFAKAHWREPGPGECPPDQRLLRLPGQRQWRCADPRLQGPDVLGSAP